MCHSNANLVYPAIKTWRHEIVLKVDICHYVCLTLLLSLSFPITFSLCQFNWINKPSQYLCPIFLLSIYRAASCQLDPSSSLKSPMNYLFQITHICSVLPSWKSWQKQQDGTKGNIMQSRKKQGKQREDSGGVCFSLLNWWAHSFLFSLYSCV